MERLEILKKQIEKALQTRPLGVSEKRHRENLAKLMDEYAALKSEVSSRAKK